MDGAERGVTHHDGQPVIVEVGVLKVFPQPRDTTGEKEEGQDACGEESRGQCCSSGDPPSCTPGKP